MEVNNARIEQMNNSTLWPELSLKSCGSDCTAGTVFTRLLLCILPSKVGGFELLDFFLV